MSFYERRKELNWNVRDWNENVKPLVRLSGEYHGES